MKYLIRICVCLLLSLPANAQVGDGVADLDLLGGWRTESGSHIAALRIRLRPGWKTYWRAPGEGGIPPRFDWTGSRNISTVRFHWPVPQVFSINGIQNIGYLEELILPIEITPKRQGQPIHIRSEVEIGVCETVCIPMRFSIRADLTVEGEHFASAIRQALRQRPMSAQQAGVRRVHCDAIPISDGLTLTASINIPPLGGREVVVFELSDQTIWISPADVSRREGQLTASADLVPSAGQPFVLDRSDVRITVIGNGTATEINGCTG